MRTTVVHHIFVRTQGQKRGKNMKNICCLLLFTRAILNFFPNFTIRKRFEFLIEYSFFLKKIDMT